MQYGIIGYRNSVRRVYETVIRIGFLQGIAQQPGDRGDPRESGEGSVRGRDVEQRAGRGRRRGNDGRRDRRGERRVDRDRGLRTADGEGDRALRKDRRKAGRHRNGRGVRPADGPGRSQESAVYDQLWDGAADPPCAGRRLYGHLDRDRRQRDQRRRHGMRAGTRRPLPG